MTDCFGYCIIPLLNEFSLAVINGCGQSTINYYVNLLQIVSSVDAASVEAAALPVAALSVDAAGASLLLPHAAKEATIADAKSTDNTFLFISFLPKNLES